MTSKFIPPNGNPLPQKRRELHIPGVVTAPPAVKTPTTVKFLDRVRVKLQRSAVLELQNSQWASFYAGAVGRVIRFNIEDGTIVVVLDTKDILNEKDRVMECFEEHDLERIDQDGNRLAPDGSILPPEESPAAADLAEETQGDA
jgi:hypothetical protein